MKRITRVDADPRTFHWHSPEGVSGVFRPQPGQRRIGPVPGPWTKNRAVLAARVVVALPDHNGRQRTVEDVIAVASAALAVQDHLALSDCIVYPGSWETWRKGCTDEVGMEGAQVILVPPGSSSKKVFHREIVKFAEAIAAGLGLAEVVVEIQRNGLAQETLGVRTRARITCRGPWTVFAGLQAHRCGFAAMPEK